MCVFLSCVIVRYHAVFSLCKFSFWNAGINSKTKTSSFQNNVAMWLFIEKYWQLFTFMYHVSVNLLKIFSLLSVNSKYCNNSFNPLLSHVNVKRMYVELEKIIIVIFAELVHFDLHAKFPYSFFSTWFKDEQIIKGQFTRALSYWTVSLYK